MLLITVIIVIVMLDVGKKKEKSRRTTEAFIPFAIPPPRVSDYPVNCNLLLRLYVTLYAKWRQNFIYQIRVF